MNSAPTSAAEIRALVERVEYLDGEISERNSDKRDIYAEAKGKGFDVPALKAVIAYRRKDPVKRAELEAIFETYLAAANGTDRATRAPAKKSVATSAPKPTGDGAAVIASTPSRDAVTAASTISDSDIPEFLRRPVQSDAESEPVSSV